MTVYLVNHLRLPADMPKPETLEYLENVESTFEPYGGKWLALDAPVQVLEGAWPGSVVLMEFPGMEEARNWYYSDAYQKILHLRTGNAINDLLLVEAVGPGFTSAAWAGGIRTAMAEASGGGS
ncbi:DUF1330 domain-containing protein [Streptomyces sp. NBC_01725]|uniref:DUF1330 domain-containing protein n=1 Tax=Streptomyces sp. NBC_01725 TaxID=2975923 RepID=UPI002E2D915F|nr:DUF1330 domain-containing protein [Streptomyces sp. NBC_01725]